MLPCTKDGGRGQRHQRNSLRKSLSICLVRMYKDPRVAGIMTSTHKLPARFSRVRRASTSVIHLQRRGTLVWPRQRRDAIGDPFATLPHSSKFKANRTNVHRAVWTRRGRWLTHDSGDAGRVLSARGSASLRPSCIVLLTQSQGCTLCIGKRFGSAAWGARDTECHYVVHTAGGCAAIQFHEAQATKCLT